MGDSLLDKIHALQAMQDTLIHHTKHLETIIQESKKDDILSKVLPFSGVILGALITYFGQYFLKNKDITVSKEKERREAISQIINCLTGIEFHLREIAYLEVDSKYQYHTSCIANGDDQKKALDEHYNDYKYIADHKGKIAFALSEIQSSFLIYYNLLGQKMPDKQENTLSELRNNLYSLKRHNEYKVDDKITSEVLEKDINDLKNEYVSKLDGIRQIAQELR